MAKQTHSPATLEVTGLRISFSVILRYISRIDTYFGTEGIINTRESSYTHTQYTRALLIVGG